MSTHPNHTHTHGAGCGHVAVRHDDHVDYLHDGHLHFQGGVAVEEHVIAVSGLNPDVCTGGHACEAHAGDHVHGADCGHATIPHGDHIDYLVDGHLHHVHGTHCDNHGPLVLA